MMKHLIYSALLVAVVIFTGCRNGNEHSTDPAQVDSFYKSAYNEELPVEQSKQEKQEGKEYQSTGAQSLLDVALPERLDNQTVRYKSIVVYFNKYYRVPNCVAYELTSTMTSMADSRDAENRANYKFEKDHDVKGCPDWWEYKESGYTRGHMAPAMDMRWDKTAMAQCFLMTNICPQLDEMNDGEWRHVEEAVHKWSRTAGRLVVFTGPIFSNNMKRIGKHQDIAVPDRFFKALAVNTGDGWQTVAFVVENSPQDGSPQRYALSVDSVETLASRDLFPSLPPEAETDYDWTFWR